MSGWFLPQQRINRPMSLVFFFFPLKKFVILLITFFSPSSRSVGKEMRIYFVPNKEKKEHKNVPGMSEIKNVFSILLLNVRNSWFADTGFILELTVDAVTV